MDVDGHRYVAEAMEPGDIVGDLWLAIDSGGRVLSITRRMADLLHWNGDAKEALGDSSDKERRRLAERILAAPSSLGEYVLSGRTCRLASARVRSPGWVFVEGLSPEAISRVGAPRMR